MEDMLLFYIKTYANDDVSCTVEKYVAHIILNSTTRATVTDMDQVVNHQVQCPIHSKEILSAQSSCRSQEG